MTEEGRQILQDAEAGNEKAKNVLRLFQLHIACPSDPGARALLDAALKDYRRRTIAEAEAKEGPR